MRRVSISASSDGLGGITAHANAAGDELSILPVGTCSMPRCEMKISTVSRLGAALDARAELVLLVRRVEDVDVLADRAPEEVVGILGAVLREVGFHDADLRVLDARARIPIPARTRAPCSTPAPAWPSRPASARCRRARSWRRASCGRNSERVPLLAPAAARPVAVVTW